MSLEIFYKACFCISNSGIPQGILIVVEIPDLEYYSGIKARSLAQPVASSQSDVQKRARSEF